MTWLFPSFVVDACLFCCCFFLFPASVTSLLLMSDYLKIRLISFNMFGFCLYLVHIIWYLCMGWLVSGHLFQFFLYRGYSLQLRWDSFFKIQLLLTKIKMESSLSMCQSLATAFLDIILQRSMQCRSVRLGLLQGLSTNFTDFWMCRNGLSFVSWLFALNLLFTQLLGSGSRDLNLRVVGRK